jgi:hypothetical protein
MKKQMKFWVTLLFFVMFLVGCGASTPYSIVPIEGVASWDGKSLSPEFSLQFEPLDGRTHSTGIIQNGGKFRTVHTPDFDGVPTGKVRVIVEWHGGLGENPPKEYEPLLKKYGHGTEGLQLEITKKDLNLTIDFQ